MALSVLGIIAPHPPIMVPEVGRRRRGSHQPLRGRARRSAAELLREFAPDTIVVMSPHATGAYDAFGVDDAPRVDGDLGQFGAPGVRITAAGDPELAERDPRRIGGGAGIPALARGRVRARRASSTTASSCR